MILHHKVNRSRGGSDTLDNAVGRHCDCESVAHQLDRQGNPTPTQIQEYLEEVDRDLAQSPFSGGSQGGTARRSRLRDGRREWRLYGVLPH